MPARDHQHLVCGRQLVPELRLLVTQQAGQRSYLILYRIFHRCNKHGIYLFHIAMVMMLM